MAFVIKFFKGIRNHWKKSAFAFAAVCYSTNYVKEKIQTDNLMRDYCLEAKKYGSETIPVSEEPRKVKVVLNPNANRRKAVSQFDKYCAPILHLAGICVDIVQTESEGHARALVQKFEQDEHVDAIVVAGGDGTLSEVVTGMFRQSTNDNRLNPCPIGVLPLGRTNTLATILFPGGDSLATARSLADAAMSIVKGKVTKVDVMKIELMDNKEKQPIYAVGSVEWGAYRDAQSKRDKYWYWGALRNYATYIFNGYKKSLNWNCNANINYLLPCGGCSNCYHNLDMQPRRWWHSFTAKRIVEKDYSKIINETCGMRYTKEINTSDFVLKTTNPGIDSTISELNLYLGPESIPYFDFISEGWKTEKNENRIAKEVIGLRELEVIPKTLDKETLFSIDKEDFEVKPVRITLLPKVLKIFCK